LPSGGGGLAAGFKVGLHHQIGQNGGVNGVQAPHFRASFGGSAMALHASAGVFPPPLLAPFSHLRMAFLSRTLYCMQWLQLNATRASFGIGLVVLVVGIALALAGGPSAISVATTAGGVLTQFIGAGFFFLYTRNLRQLNIFYASLVQRDDLMFAYGLTSQIPEEMKPGVIHSMIMTLLARNGPAMEMSAEPVRALNEKRS
jgi:hypothetical protein